VALTLLLFRVHGPRDIDGQHECEIHLVLGLGDM
jgi:hypothetical protein